MCILYLTKPKNLKYFKYYYGIITSIDRNRHQSYNGFHDSTAWVSNPFLTDTETIDIHCNFLDTILSIDFGRCEYTIT